MDSPAGLVPLGECIARRWLGWKVPCPLAQEARTNLVSEKSTDPAHLNLHGDVISLSPLFHWENYFWEKTVKGFLFLEN